MSVRSFARCRSLFQSSVGKKDQLQKFIRVTKGFNEHSFGEIQFEYRENFSSYSPFVTVTPDVAPEKVWKLMIGLWDLSPPHGIVSLGGVFTKADCVWNEVADQAWLITTGSSPCQHRHYMCIIAIIPLSKLGNKEALFNDLPQGSFPVFRHRMASRSSDNLDSNHSHFILVDGDIDSTINLRQNILTFIRNLPLNDDLPRYSTGPIANVMITEDAETWKMASLAAATGLFPTVVADTAPRAHKIVELIKKSNDQNPSASEWRFSAEFHSFSANESLKDDIEKCVNTWILKPNTVTLYKKSESEKPTQALMGAVLHSSIFSRRSMIHLAVAWKMMDVIKSLLYSWKQFEEEEHHLLDYLTMALAYDYAEFLEYFEELGINMLSSLTENFLRSLYNQTLYHKQFETRTSFLVRKILNDQFIFPNCDVLQSIDRIISHLTHHEVSGLYSKKIHKERTLTSSNSQSVADNPANIASSSVQDHHLRYPERDLFLWCIFFGKYKVAKVLWKQSSALAALSMIACALIEGEKSAVNECTYDDALAEDLNDAKMAWTKTALDFIDHSYKQSKTMTLAYLTMPLEIYGVSSTLSLAYFTNQVKFVAHPALQNALDLIWLGKTKKDSAHWRVFLTICPFLVPWLDVVTNNTSNDYCQKGVMATFKQDENNSSFSQAGSCDVIFPRRSQKKRKSKGFWKGLMKYGKDIYDYYNSPVAKFRMHLMFLIAAILFLALSLILSSIEFDVQDGQLNETVWQYSVLTSEDYHKLNMAVLFLLTSYVVGVAADELRQIATAGNSKAIRRRVRKWYASYWNRIDAIMTLSYIIGLIIFLYGPNHYATNFTFKFFFSISLATMQLRFFQSYYVFRSVGPKVIMIKEMFKDLAVFFYIMVPVFLSYGVILSSFIGNFDQYNVNASTSSSAFDGFILKTYNIAIRRPIWHLFVSGQEHISETPPESLAELVNGLIVVLYLLFSNILMINLLIALFNNTFEKIHENANECWKYQRFEIVHEFLDRPLLPSPFIILEDIGFILKWCMKKCPTNRSIENKYGRFQANMFVNRQEEDVWSFEKDILQTKFKNEEPKQSEIKQESQCDKN